MESSFDQRPAADRRRHAAGLRTMLVATVAVALFGLHNADVRAELSRISVYADAQRITTPETGYTYDATNNVYTITSRGADLWGTSDPGGTFIYDPNRTSESFTAIVRSVSINGTLTDGEWGRTGIMARAHGMAANSANIHVMRKSAGDPLRIGHRTNTGAATDAILIPAGNLNVYGNAIATREGRNFYIANGHGTYGYPMWMALSRQIVRDAGGALISDTFYAQYAADVLGQPAWGWSTPVAVTAGVGLSGQPVHLGLAHQSHNNGMPAGVANTAVFENWEVRPFGLLPVGPFRPAFEFPTTPWGSAGQMYIREVINNGNMNDNNHAVMSLISSLSPRVGTIVEYTAPTLNIWDSGGQGRFPTANPFGVVTAGHRTQGAVDHIAALAKGTIRIPEGEEGVYTFVVNSDDSFRLFFPGQNFTSVTNGVLEAWAPGALPGGTSMGFLTGRGVADTLGQITLPAGDHPFVLTFHEGGGGAAVEFFAAKGSHTAYAGSGATWRLVGQQGGELRTYMTPTLVPLDEDGNHFDITVIRGNTGESLEAHNAVQYDAARAWFAAAPGTRVEHTGRSPYIHHRDPENGLCCGAVDPVSGVSVASMPGLDDLVDNNNYVSRFTGTLNVPAAGWVRFIVQSDDGVHLNIPGTSMDILGAVNGAPYLADGGQTVRLEVGTGYTGLVVDAYFSDSGLYPMTLYQFEGNGGSYVSVAMAEGDMSVGSPFGFNSVLIGANAIATATEFHRVSPGLQLVAFPEGFGGAAAIVPEPSAAWLVLTGLVGLPVLRRAVRRKRSA